MIKIQASCDMIHYWLIYRWRCFG